MPLRSARSALLVIALLLLGSGCGRAPAGNPPPPEAEAPSPTGSGLPAPAPVSSMPCVESCGAPERPCALTRERLPESERPGNSLHYAVDGKGALFAAWTVFVGADPLSPKLESRVGVREPSGEWRVQPAPWPELHGIAVGADGSLIVHADEDTNPGGGALFRLDGAREQLGVGKPLEWLDLGGRHGERVPLLDSLELTPQGTLATAFESPFALGVFDGRAWRRQVIGDYYQLQSPHIAVDEAGGVHAFVAFPGRYDEPLWVGPSVSAEPAPVAGPFALEPNEGDTRVHVLGQRCTAPDDVCYTGTQIAGWELVYAVREAGTWRTPLVQPNFSTDPRNACSDCSAVESDARAAVGAALGGCGGVRLFIERTWNRPSCADLPEGTEACSGRRLEIVTLEGERTQTTSLAEDLVPVRRFVTAPDGAFHALGFAPDRSGIEHYRLAP